MGIWKNLRISWTEHVINNEVMRRMNKEMEVLETIKIRKLHFTRGENSKKREL